MCVKKKRLYSWETDGAWLVYCMYRCLRLAILSLYVHVGPPLTVENVMTVVRSVRNWKTLAEQLVITYNDLYNIEDDDLDDLQRRHSSDEDCLKEVVDTFLRGDRRYYQHRLSWRMVLWCLVMANEAQLALHFKSYSEQLEGTCVCLWFHLTTLFEIGPLASRSLMSACVT